VRIEVTPMPAGSFDANAGFTAAGNRYLRPGRSPVFVPAEHDLFSLIKDIR
jgi:hypothetical protein